MADPLYDLLAPYFDGSKASVPNLRDSTTSNYLTRLSTLQLTSFDTTEPQSLAQSSHSNLLSIQALSTRSNRAILSSADELKSIGSSLTTISGDINGLESNISKLDTEAVNFSQKYSRSGENEVLDRRKKALLMSRNVDRLSDVFELPALLESAINASASQGSSINVNYASALDLHSHIKRLHQIYPKSAILKSVHRHAENSMKEMKSHLVQTLQSQNLKLAAGMRTIGWLRRIAPELGDKAIANGANTEEGSFGALFLACRFVNLLSTLEALEPLRELADQETERRISGKEPVTSGNAWSGGQQTERYLKRYIEIFREQSFAMVSMFKSVFPSGEAAAHEDLGAQFKSLGLKSAMPQQQVFDKNDPLHPLPTALATFPLHLVDLLADILRQYMPNIRDKSSRESILTQVLYCAGSLGRLGGDFSMVLAILNDDDDDDDDDDTALEWVSVMKKHRVLAGRLELLASGAGSHSKGNLKGMEKGVDQSLRSQATTA